MYKKIKNKKHDCTESLFRSRGFSDVGSRVVLGDVGSCSISRVPRSICLPVFRGTLEPARTTTTSSRRISGPRAEGDDVTHRREGPRRVLPGERPPRSSRLQIALFGHVGAISGYLLNGHRCFSVTYILPYAGHAPFPRS